MSIHSICLILLFAKLNDLTFYQADVRNAYLEAYTNEMIYFIVGREFTAFKNEYHILVISKALHRLCTSGKWFHEVFTDMLHIEGFMLCKANSDV